MPIPEPGTQAPAFSKPDQAGSEVSLDALKGKWVVLYFYPRDDTPGCTREACNFRDFHSELQAAGAVILGVSPDTAAAHVKFAAKFELPFQLLVDDAEHSLANAYGAWGMKKNYGREYMGMNRITVLVDPEGKVAHVWPKVKPDAHGEDVLKWIKSQAAA